MAIIDNRTTEEGDVLIIKTEIPVVGLISLYNFVDTTGGESELDYYLKEFRYSINGGITFSSWAELTTLNISNININKFNQFVIEYRYIHVGESPGVELEFDNILVSGEINDLPYPIYESTYFNKFFTVNDINVYGWALNVLEKLYSYGILPEYMIRGKQSDNILEDQDFISFWNSITHFFAILVYFSRQFRDISLNEDLLVNFFKNKDISISGLSFFELVDLFQDYISVFSKRGTLNCVENELYRAISKEDSDEFIFSHLRPEETGWCVGKSSPCWDNTEDMINLIKGYEYTETVGDLDNYPLINSSYVSLVSEEIIVSSVPDFENAGIDYDNDTTKKILVDSGLDYEISFKCELTEINTPITFGVRTYDVNMNPLSCVDLVSGSNSNYFFQSKTLHLTDQKYWIRGILYNYNQSLSVSKTFYPEGRHLKTNLNAKYIVPIILLDNSNSVTPNGLKITDIKVRPLKAPFTRGQLGIKNIMLFYMKNNSKEYSQNALEEKISRELLPAKSFLKIKYL